jgi:hypothetical protein
MEVGTKKQTDVQTRELFRLQRQVAEQEEELARYRSLASAAAPAFHTYVV